MNRETFLLEIDTLRGFLDLLEQDPCEFNVIHVEQAAKSVAYCARQLVEVSHG